MKLVFTVLFSYFAFAASSSIQEIAEQRRKLDTANALREKWLMHHPRISYESAADTFTLDFFMSSTEMNASLGMLEEEFYDYNCKNDGSGFDEYIIPAGGLTNPDTGGRPEMTNNVVDGKPQLKFKVQTAILANDTKLYTFYNNTNNSTNSSNSTI